MRKALLIILTIILTLGAVIGLSVTAFAQDTVETDVIPVPDFPSINRPYKTIEELGVDFETIDEYFPRNIEVRYEDGKVYVEDIGVGYVKAYASNSYVLKLIDGYWTAEIEGELSLIEFYPFDNYWEERYWQVVYVGNGERESYIHINDDTKGEHISFSYEYGNVTVRYRSGDYCYEDIYMNGVLEAHKASNRQDKEYVNEAVYDVDGNLSYCTLLIDTYYYYFPNQGWSSSRDSFIEHDAPEGYEDIDETYFTANKLSLICNRAEREDILHDMIKEFCTTLDTCKNGCGYTEGTIEHHTWQTIDGKKVCSVCDAVFFPEFEYVDRTYNTVEETGFPYDEYRILFPEVLTIKYEDGKYMIKDVGAERAEACISTDDYVDIPLVDGWWIFELDEETYSDESIDIFVTFRGELNGGLWNINYFNGGINGSLYIESENTTPSVRVYYAGYDWVCFIYYVGGRRYTDGYTNGVFSSQDVIMRYGDDDLNINYSADGTIESIYINVDGDWFYYYSDRGWENGSGEPIAAPEGYENSDIEFFNSIAPTTINCAHEKYSEADCLNPERCLICGIAKEGSEPLGHDIAVDETIEPTCIEIGFTEGSHCSVCGEILVEQDEIPALGHTEETLDGKEPTCTEVGLTEGTKCSVCGEILTAQSKISEVGHKYDNACDNECNVCKEVRTPAEHLDTDENYACDECGAELPKDGISGGAIAGIVIGSVAILGLGGFALYWFVFRKKKVK